MPEKTKNKVMSKKYKIITSIGLISAAAAGTAGGLTYAFVFKNKPEIIKLGDIFSYDKFSDKFFSFSGVDGSGTIKYIGENLSNKISIRYTKVYSSNSKVKTEDLKDKDFSLESKNIKNLKNEDVFYAKFFSNNKKAFQLDNSLKTIWRLKVKNLAAAPINLHEDLRQFQTLHSTFTKSQLFEKFKDLSKGDILLTRDLGIANEDSFHLRDNLEIKYFFDSFSDDKTLKLKISLINDNSQNSFEYKNNSEIFSIIPSKDYSYVQEYITSNQMSLNAIYKKGDVKTDPSQWTKINGEIQIPQNFSLQDRYKYTLPTSLGDSIYISSYKSLEVENNILKVVAEIKDSLLPKDSKINNNEIIIKFNLIETENIPNDLQSAKNFLNLKFSENTPYQMNLNFSQLKSLFLSHKKGYQIDNIISLPLDPILKATFYLESWLDQEKLLKVKVKIQKIMDEEETFIYLKGSSDLSSEITKVSNYFFQNNHFFSPLTSQELTTKFSSFNPKQKIEITDIQEIVPEAQGKINLTEGIEMEFQFVKWDQKWDTLEFDAILKDNNIAPNLTNKNNKIRAKVKLFTKDDFKEDIAIFTDYTSSRLTYAELYNRFNEEDGVIASQIGQEILPIDFDFITPNLSNGNIEAKYYWMGYDDSNHEHIIKVVLSNPYSKNQFFPDKNNFKEFKIKGSNDLSSYLKTINTKYTVFSDKDTSALSTYFNKFSSSVDKNWDFETEFPDLDYQAPKLIPNIELSYKFKSFQDNEIILEAILEDTKAPNSINNTKNITIKVVPAYNYQSIVQAFRDQTSKKIESFNNSQLYNLFYDDKGNPKQNKGSVIDPDDFGFKNKILLPNNFKIKYQFNGWDYDNNMLKVKVNFKNDNLPSQIIQTNYIFDMLFYGTNDLQAELNKIQYKENQNHDFRINLNPVDTKKLISSIQNNIKSKLSYAEFRKLFKYKINIYHWLSEIGLENLTNGIKYWFTINEIEDGNNQNPVIKLKIELEDTKAAKVKDNEVTNNVINQFKMRIIPRYEIQFISDFLNPWPNVTGLDPSKILSPRGLIDLSKISGVPSYNQVKKHKSWDGNTENKYHIPDFFARFIGYSYGKWSGSKNHWSLKKLFDKYNIIDPNTNEPFNEEDFSIRVSIQGYDDINKYINIKMHVEFIGSSKRKWPPILYGQTKEDLYLPLHIKFK